MLFNFANVAIFLIFCIGFVTVLLLLPQFFAPKAPSKEKGTPYECGEEPVGTPWIRFNPRYYMVALIFLIFDVEVAFMFPCVAVFKDFVDQGLGRVALLEIGAFVFVLMVGLAYIWKKGDLTWAKYSHEEDLVEGSKNSERRWVS